MYSVISPAKSLDYETELATETVSEPRFLESAEQLVEIMAKKSPADLVSLMKISQKLAELNVERFLDFTRPFTPQNARQAILAFDGDVYRGLDAPNRFKETDFEQAQTRLGILSGLYGLLRPLDLMMPYRLEMGTKLANGRGENLYDFWKKEITETVIAEVKASPGADVLVNLASNEYFSAIDTAAVEEAGIEIISPRFLDSKDGNEPKVVAFHAKRARGEMSAYIILEKIDTPEGLKDFDATGYRYAPNESTSTTPTYIRHN